MSRNRISMSSFMSAMSGLEQFGTRQRHSGDLQRQSDISADALVFILCDGTESVDGVRAEQQSMITLQA